MRPDGVLEHPARPPKTMELDSMSQSGGYNVALLSMKVTATDRVADPRQTSLWGNSTAAVVAGEMCWGLLA